MTGGARRRPVLLYGPAEDGKRRAAAAWAAQRIRAGSAVLYLTRSPLRAQALADANALHRGGLVDQPFQDVAGWARQWQPVLCPEVRLLSPVESGLLVRAVRDEVARSADEESWCHDRSAPGALQHWLEAVGGAGIRTAEALARRFSRFATPGPRESFLERVLTTYEAALGEAGATDGARSTLEVAHAIEAGASAWDPPELLVLEGCESATPAEWPLLRALAASCTTLALADDETLDTLPWLRDARAIAWHPGLALPELGLSAAPGGEARAVSIEVRVASDRAQEVAAVARDIRLRLDAGAPASSLKVCAPRIEAVMDELEEVLCRYGVPVHVHGGRPLSRLAPTIALRAFLDLPMRRWDLSALLALGDSPFFRYEPDGAERAAALARLGFQEGVPGESLPIPGTEERARAARVAAGLGIARLDDQGLAALAARRVAHPAVPVAGPGPNAPPAVSDGPELSSLVATVAWAECWRALYPLPGPAPLATFAEWLRGVLDRLGFFQLAGAPLQPFEPLPRWSPDVVDGAAWGLARARAWNSAASHTIGAVLDELDAVAWARPDVALDYATACRWLIDALAARSATRRQEADEVVALLHRRQLDGVEAGTLYFIGLDETSWPVSEDRPVLLDEAEASALGVVRGGSAEAKRLLALARAGAERLVLSWAVRDGKRERQVALPVADLALAPCPWPGPDPERPLSIAEAHAAVGAAWRSGSAHRMAVAAPLALWTGGLSLAAGPRSREARARPGLGPYDGLLSPESASALLAPRLGAGQVETVASASLLERLATCPARTFYERVLGLEASAALREEISPLERGQRLHRILRRFYSVPQGLAVDTAFVDRREADPGAWVEEARQRMARLAAEELGGAGLNDLVWQALERDLLAGLDGGGEQGLLAAFVRGEADQAGTGLRPAWLEATFGMEATEGLRVSRGPVSLETGDPSSPLKLRGAIDRIDRYTGTDPPLLLVYDYKTLDPPPYEEVRSGPRLQLPLYLAAAAALLAPERAGGAAFLSVRPGSPPRRRVYFAVPEVSDPLGVRAAHREDAEQLEARLVDAAARGRTLLGLARAGVFPPTSGGAEAAGCRSCPMARCCTVDHTRMAAWASRSAGERW